MGEKSDNCDSSGYFSLSILSCCDDQIYSQRCNCRPYFAQQCYLPTTLKARECVTRFFATGFFHESVSPQPQSIPLRPFRIFSKIRGDIRK
jgi:hypothetical protein